MLHGLIVYKYNKLTSCHSINPSPYFFFFSPTLSITKSLAEPWVSLMSSSSPGHKRCCLAEEAPG